MSNAKAPFDFDKGDDLSDFFGDGAPKTLPTDESFARIRAHGTGEVPAAPSFKVPCKKCGGSGVFRGWSGRQVGPCFTCKGKGFFDRKTSPVKLAASRERAQERKVATIANNWTTFTERFPAEAAVLTKGIAQTWGDGQWNTICSDIKGKVEKYGDLHEGTMAMLGRAVARDVERAAKKAETTAEVAKATAGIDVANIAALFRNAREAGLKRFTLRFADAHFQADKNDPALIWISKAGYGSEKYGRIVGETYKPGYHVNADVLARIAEISKDPMAAAKAYAQETSSCSVCGRHLENQVSVEEGIGPICAGRLNHKPGAKFVPVAEGDF